MKKIDIELLLRWAIREELPKAGKGSRSAWGLISNFASLGTRVDTSFRGVDAFQDEPHPDADKIATAIRALPDDASLSRAECNSLIGDFAALEPETVSAFSGAQFDLRPLVIRCAALGERMPHAMPHWPHEVPTPQQMFLPSQGGRPRALVLGRNPASGALVALKLASGRAHQRGELYSLAHRPYSPLEWHAPTVGQLLRARAEYTLWRHALAILARNLTGALDEFEVTGPAAPVAPWSLDASEKRVFQAPAIGGDPLPLKPMRTAAARPHRVGYRAPSARVGLDRARAAQIRRR